MDLYDAAEEIVSKYSPPGTRVIRNASGGIERYLPGLVGHLFRIVRPETVRIGHDFFEGRLKVGDLVLGIGHCGDCFQYYIFIEEFTNCLRGSICSVQYRFGSYGIGDNPEAAEYELTEEAFEVLKKGGRVDIVGQYGSKDPQIIRRTNQSTSTSL